MQNNRKINLVSVVVPVYNEEEVLPEFHRRVSKVLEDMYVSSEIIYINDGSWDGTLNVLHKLKEDDPQVAILDLSRNFGKEAALTAGIDYARGDVVAVIDADLQDPPELIPTLIKAMDNQYDVVYAKRVSRDGESFLKKKTASLFYRLMRNFGRIQIPRDTGDFRVMSRRAVDSLKQLREHHRFMKGLFTWIGYPQKAVSYHRDPRYAGKTKWNYWKLWNFAIEGITSYTSAPLKIATYIGGLIASIAFLYALFIITKTLIFGEIVKGYPSLMVVMLFLGGIQLIFIGMVGEYLGRTFNESKRRPLYFIKDYRPSKFAELKYPDTPSVEFIGKDMHAER